MRKLTIDITEGMYDRLARVAAMRNELYRQWKEAEDATVENTAAKAVEFGSEELDRSRKKDLSVRDWTPEKVAMKSLDLGLKRMEKVLGYEPKPAED